MNIKRAFFMAVLVVALAALAVPLVGLRASAAGTVAGKSATARAEAARATAAVQQQVEQQEVVGETRGGGEAAGGKISVETMKALGLTRVANPAEASARVGQKLQGKKRGGGEVSIQSGQPLLLDARSALSAALITTIGGRDNQFSEVTLIADWDGREDCAADREQKVDDFSSSETEIDQSLTRAAISEHTVANGFNENVYYYGDSLGNLWVGTDTNPGLGSGVQIDALRQINIPALYNTGASGGFTLTGAGCTDDQVAVTGIAVNPVADLCDFGLAGTIGEIVYVSVFDSEGCTANAAGQIIRTRILEFAFTDGAGAGAATPAGVRQIQTSTLGNIAGVSVDDDGSLYFQLVDLIQFTGGAIFKLTELPRSTCGGVNCISRVIPPVAAVPTNINVWQGTAANPIVTAGGVRGTNYSGPSTLFGDVVALANGGCNVLYAAVSPSFVAGAVSFEQLTQGLFPAPSAFTAGTPSMIISFADCSGLFDICSGNATGSVSVNVGGILPVADGFADVAQNGLTRTPGVNNFRIFAQGNGPNLAPAAGGTAIVPGTPVGLKKIDMQIDYTLHSGLAVNEQNTVFVISGGTPAGIGKNPSPMLGEVLCFEDGCPADRRADFVDLRDSTLPNPPASGGNTSTTGVSDRFDHIFYQSPLDQVTLTPGGLAGLADGFLRYTNRLAPNAISPGVALGNTERVQGDDTTTGSVVGGVFVPAPIFFEWLDAGHQVAGGDDQNSPNRGDDSDSIPGTALGSPAPIPAVPNSSAAGTQRNGGFEYLFGGPVGNCVWNGFFLNSNGNITFGVGSTANTPLVPNFRTGPPRIAPAWTDLNPASRGVACGTFPVQAVGFANVNAFKVRWINVPEFGDEACTVGGIIGGVFVPNLAGASNTFSVTLFDDGTGADENTTETLSATAAVGNNIDDGAAVFDRLEGPTDLRFTREPNTQVLVGCSPRPEGSGVMIFDYCRMDLLGTEEQPVLTGFSIGGASPFNTGLNPPGLCETNLGCAALAADAGTFGVINCLPSPNQIAAVGCNCLIGEGTEPTIFELFNEGLTAGTGSGGEVTFARPDFDLRFEGNDAVLCSSARQRDLNRGRVGFLGIGCTFPANPVLCVAGTGSAIVPGTFVTTPTTTGIVNALCAVQLNLVGCGFFPNETTVICQGFQTETGLPLQRNGKTVTTTAELRCDTNGDGILEAAIALTNVTPVNCNLVRATIPALASRPGTAFGDACCGGIANVVVTTTFTAGDNNVFGAFTRTASCTLQLGTRAPVVFSVTPSDGSCALPIQNLLISGACFCFVQEAGATDIIGGVTSVIFQDRANPANTITVGLNPSASGQVKPLTCQLLDVEVNFTSANAGKTFLVFVVGTGGTSRNLTAAVAGAPAGCPLGNEQGIQVTFTCSSSTIPTPVPTPDIAVVTACLLDRQPTGQFFLDVTVTNAKDGATATISGQAPKKIKVIEVAPGTTNPTKLRLVKKICQALPGNIVVTNPGPNGAASQPFNCTAVCPAQ
jgi:hypothetical protein